MAAGSGAWRWRAEDLGKSASTRTTCSSLLEMMREYSVFDLKRASPNHRIAGRPRTIFRESIFQARLRAETVPRGYFEETHTAALLGMNHDLDMERRTPESYRSNRVKT